LAVQNIEEYLVYVGTYTHGDSEGIYVYRIDISTGALGYSSKATGVENPSFLAVDPESRYLYSVCEVAEFAGQPTGVLKAYAISPETGELTYLNQQPSGGTVPCHVTVDQTGRFLLVANFGSGSVAALAILGDGRLGEATGFVQHEGSGVNPQLQDGPHAHSINLDPANRYALAPDRGIDKVLVYRLDLEGGRLVPNDEPWASVKPGAGPRHFDFHPSGRYAYVINEIDSTITAFTYDGAKGRLREIHTVSTLPEDFEGSNTCADIHVSPSGRFVYGSNRGHDSIAIFAIDLSTGRLTHVDHEPTQGKTPRNFAIDPSGTLLLAANQDSDTIVTFRIDQETGKLEPTGHVANVPSPACLTLIPAPTR
jgi:6-phosphogluconolactonase